MSTFDTICGEWLTRANDVSSFRQSAPQDIMICTISGVGF